jgi:hypothetical protein
LQPARLLLLLSTVTNIIISTAYGQLELAHHVLDILLYPLLLCCKLRKQRGLQKRTR